MFGNEAQGLGNYYTTVNPGTVADFRTTAGLFPTNSGSFVLEGTLNNTEGVIFRSAAPGPGGVGGGLPEVYVPNPSTQITIQQSHRCQPAILNEKEAVFEMKSLPDFFLSTAGENEGLATPRACWKIARLKDQVRDDHMLVEIEPPVIGQNYGLGNQDIANLILSARYEGFSLFPVKEWPCHVYVARILDDTITQTLSFTRDQVEIIAWGIIFCTLDEASAHAKKFQSCRA